jgi:hypothetical protein
MLNELVVRIGTFLMLLAFGMLILFAASDYAHQANFDYLFWAVLAVTIGLMLRKRRPPRPPSGRFETLRKWRGNSKDDNQDE